jgi:hypothetical protein
MTNASRERTPGQVWRGHFAAVSRLIATLVSGAFDIAGALPDLLTRGSVNDRYRWNRIRDLTAIRVHPHCAYLALPASNIDSGLPKREPDGLLEVQPSQLVPAQ